MYDILSIVILVRKCSMSLHAAYYHETTFKTLQWQRYRSHFSCIAETSSIVGLFGPKQSKFIFQLNLCQQKLNSYQVLHKQLSLLSVVVLRYKLFFFTYKFKEKLIILQSIGIIIQFSSTESCRFRISCPKISPQNQHNIYFVTCRQDWLGMAKPINVFKSTISPSAKLI